MKTALLVIDMHTEFEPPVQTIREVVRCIQIARSKDMEIINLAWREYPRPTLSLVPEVKAALEDYDKVTTITKKTNDGSESLKRHFEDEISNVKFIVVGIRYFYCIKETLVGLNIPDNHIIILNATDAPYLDWRSELQAKSDDKPSDYKFNVYSGEKYEGVFE